jgi:hypothetical protein
MAVGFLKSLPFRHIRFGSLNDKVYVFSILSILPSQSRKILKIGEKNWKSMSLYDKVCVI